MAPPPIPVFRPALPRRERLTPYLDRIDAARWYSNRGPLVREFEAALADHFGCAAEHVVVTANGTLALTAALMALKPAPRGHSILPSWTFPATALAAVQAGLTPYFADIEEHSWALAPDTAETLATQRDVGVVMPVAPFGMPLNRAYWDAFTVRTGIPALIDAAAGFDSVARIEHAGPGPTPIMISLHATKVFGIGEGGVVLSTDGEFIARLRSVINYGFSGSRESQGVAVNGKLSEYGAAVGLAGLETWPDDRKEWQALTERHAAAIESLPQCTTMPCFGDGWVSAYGNVVLPSGAALALVRAALDTAGVDHRHWWNEGCHRQAAFATCPRGDLAAGTALAARVLGLPFWRGLGESDQDRVFKTLDAAMGKITANWD